MKNPYKILIRILICLVLAAGAYFWLTALMDSLNTYRSALKDHPPAPGEALLPPGSQPTARRVIFVLVDALREDTALDPEVMPFLDELRQKGAWATMHSRPPSYSEPAYTVLLTGAWPDLSDGHTINEPYENIRTITQDDLFSASQRAGLRTGLSGYYWFEKLLPQGVVNQSFYTAGEDQQADRQVVDAALPWLRAGETQLVLIHLDQVDYAGHHEGGPGDQRWDEAAKRADDLIREIASSLDLSQDVLLVVSDHGQVERGGHGGNEAVVLTEPFVLAGAGVRPGNYGDIQMVDVAPTLAAILGTALPASSQGHVRQDMLDLPQEELDSLPGALQAQQAQLVKAYQQAIGKQSQVTSGEDVVASYQAALEKARSSRLSTERLPRLALALLALGLPWIWLLHRSRRELAWLMGAGLIYTFLFHLGYSLLGGRTYSLSSVTSAGSLIIFCVGAALISILAGFVFFFLAGRFSPGTPSLGILHGLDLSLVILYLLFIPLLVSFTLNGALVTWTLPEFTRMFLGFLSLIQILIVGSLGPLLAGGIGLVVKIKNRKPKIA